MSVLTSRITNKTKRTLDVLLSLRTSLPLLAFLVCSLLGVSVVPILIQFLLPPTQLTVVAAQPTHSSSYAVHSLPCSSSRVLVHRAYPLRLSQRPLFTVPHIELPPLPPQIGFCPLDFGDGPIFCFLRQVKGYLDFTSTCHVCCVCLRKVRTRMSPVTLLTSCPWLMMGC